MAKGHVAPQPDLPMPGERLHGAVVVASVWVNDEGPDLTALVLLLRPEPQFYAVADIYQGRKTSGWEVSYETEHPNIVPAVDEYQERGGDY